MTSPFRPSLALLAVLFLLPACRKDNDRPTQPEVPAPTPTPAPATSPPALACHLPPGTGTGEDCPQESPTFQDQVEHAIDLTVAAHPEMVDTTRVRGCGNCYLVLDTHNFPEEVGRTVEKTYGYCWKYDGEELAVKNINDFNDQYDILLSEGFIRREAIGSYRATCRPAWF